ncbi:SDR family NAD(P)-dependent oxidoreductase [uncultured Nostoc sp.]|uniref:SDR family NAD(P)-dependent oxidoreductase n=1 Tax=uncultured Nostoc sp. TaxID=340711 RepID=UPI0035CAA515
MGADFFESDDALWEMHWEINVMAAVRLARAYLPGMKQAGWGRFIILGSTAAFNVPPEMIHYGVSKTADVRSESCFPQTTLTSRWTWRGAGLTICSLTTLRN